MRVETNAQALINIPANQKYPENPENKDLQRGKEVLLVDQVLEQTVSRKNYNNNKVQNNPCMASDDLLCKKVKKVKPPLYRAAEKGNIQKLISNLEKGADPNQLCNDQPHLWPLLAACVLNNAECVRILLENGANPNVVDRGGYSPLSYAVSNARNTPEICKLLLQHGASLDAKSGTHMTIAQRFENFEPSEFTLPNEILTNEIIKQFQIKKSE